MSIGIIFIQFRYCWTGEPVHFTEYGGFHISEVLIVHKHVNVFGTKQSVHNIVDGCFSEVSVSWSSTEAVKDGKLVVAWE